MSPEKLSALFAAGAAADPVRSPACPDEHQIAGFVDGGLAEAAHRQVELHLADCARCLQLVRLLSLERDADEGQPVAHALVAAAHPPPSERSRQRWRFAPQWAAAAAVVLAVPLLLQLSRNLERGDEGQGRPEPPATRTLAPAKGGLLLLSPAAGVAVDSRRLSFRWTAVAGTPYYDLRIVTDTGDVVIQQRVTGTTWQPPARLNLQPGAEYFVHIEAYPSGDKPVSSDHVPFRVAD